MMILLLLTNERGKLYIKGLVVCVCVFVCFVLWCMFVCIIILLLVFFYDGITPTLRDLSLVSRLSKSLESGQIEKPLRAKRDDKLKDIRSIHIAQE